MKTSGRCPKCTGERFYVVDQVQQTYCDAQTQLRAFHLTGARLPTGQKGMFGGDTSELEVAGPFSAWVCAACGFTEWYLPDRALKMLARMVAVKAVRVVEKKPPPTPFR